MGRPLSPERLAELGIPLLGSADGDPPGPPVISTNDQGLAFTLLVKGRALADCRDYLVRVAFMRRHRSITGDAVAAPQFAASTCVLRHALDLDRSSAVPTGVI